MSQPVGIFQPLNFKEMEAQSMKTLKLPKRENKLKNRQKYSVSKIDNALAIDIKSTTFSRNKMSQGFNNPMQTTKQKRLLTAAGS